MVRRTLLASVLLAGALGCGTVNNIKQPSRPPASNPNAPVCLIYGGVRGDWDAMTELSWKDPPSYADYVVLPLMCALDLILTSAGDTVTLPYTIGAEIARGVRPYSNPDEPLPSELKKEAERAKPATDPEAIQPTGAVIRGPLRTENPARQPGAVRPR